MVLNKIFIRGKCARRGRTALERGQSKVARLGIQPNGVLTVAVAQVTMTAGTISTVIGMRLRSIRMPGHIADMALHFRPRVRGVRTHIGRILRIRHRESDRENETEKCYENIHSLEVFHRHPQNEFAGELITRGSILVRSQSQSRSRIRWCSRWWCLNQPAVQFHPDAASCTRCARRNLRGWS